MSATATVGAHGIRWRAEGTDATLVWEVTSDVEELYSVPLGPTNGEVGAEHRGVFPLHGGGLAEALVHVRAYAVQDGEVPRVPLVRVGVFGRVDVRRGLAVIVEVEPCEGARAVVAPFLLALVRVLVVPPFVDQGEVFRLFFALLVPLWSGGGRCVRCWGGEGDSSD